MNNFSSVSHITKGVEPVTEPLSFWQKAKFFPRIPFGQLKNKIYSFDSQNFRIRGDFRVIWYSVPPTTNVSEILLSQRLQEQYFRQQWGIRCLI